MPDPVTVSNSSCLIGLELIGRLDLLHELYGTVTAPSAVAHECGSRLPPGSTSNPSRTKSWSVRCGLDSDRESPKPLSWQAKYRGLFAVNEGPELDGVDTVSRSLRRGRMICEVQ